MQTRLRSCLSLSLSLIVVALLVGPSAATVGLLTGGPATHARVERVGAGALLAGAPRAAPSAEVFGYLPYWLLGRRGVQLHLDIISTVAFFGIGASADGTLMTKGSNGAHNSRWRAWTSAAMTSVIRRAHAAGARVVLSIQRFAWGPRAEDRTRRLLSSPTARTRLAASIASAVWGRGVDGADLDFEPMPEDLRDDYVAFVRGVRAALDARAPGYQLTFAATRQKWLAGYDIAALTAPGAADAVFVMGYGYRSAGSPLAGATAPLDRAPEPVTGPEPTTATDAAPSAMGLADPSPSATAAPVPSASPPDETDDLRSTLAAYLAQTSADHIILGLPFYGQAWSTLDGSLRASTRPRSRQFGRSVALTYASAVGVATSHGRRYDPLEATAWTAYRYRACDTCPTTMRELYYDDATSLGAKVRTARSLGLRGVGIWALGYDGSRPELGAAIRQALR